MRMSPFDMSGVSLASIPSTDAAGTISHTARGPLSFLTKSSSPVDPTAPSFTSSATVVALKSATTTSWPAFIKRRTMPAPILPKPIIPSCIVNLLVLSLANPAPQLRRSAKFQTALDIVQVNAQRLMAAIRQHLKVTARLRGLYDAEFELIFGNRYVYLDAAGNPRFRPPSKASRLVIFR